MAAHRRSHHSGTNPADPSRRWYGKSKSHPPYAPLFSEWSNSIRYRLDDALAVSHYFQSLKTQIVSAVTWCLNCGDEFNPLPVIDVRVFDSRDSTTSIDGHVDRGRLIFQEKQIGAIAHRAGLDLVGIERRHSSHSTPQCDLLQMKRFRIIDDFLNGNGLRGRDPGGADSRPPKPNGYEKTHRYICERCSPLFHGAILQEVAPEVPSASSMNSL